MPPASRRSIPEGKSQNFDEPRTGSAWARSIQGGDSPPYRQRSEEAARRMGSKLRRLDFAKKPATLRTTAVQMKKVTLRQWQDSDLAPYTTMNQDPEVMRYFPALRTPEETKESFERQRSLIAERGWGLWAVE